MLISPPRPKGPQLNALRAFEAAARLGGFVRAADELCVTPGAISQHIKSLEEWAGKPLFERRSRGVTLTPLGLEVAESFTNAFDALGEATRTLISRSDRMNFNIAALPCVAQLWLSPRLPKIREKLSTCKLSVTALDTTPNLKRELFDMSIYIDKATGDENEKVLEIDTIFPVCSKQIARKLRTTKDLENEIWLHDATWSEDWGIWLNEAAPHVKKARGDAQFSLYSIAVEEAKNSAGILMGHKALIETELMNGSLVAPFPEKIQTSNSLNVRTPPNVAKSLPLSQIMLALGVH